MFLHGIIFNVKNRYLHTGLKTVKENTSFINLFSFLTVVLWIMTLCSDVEGQ